MYHFLGGISYLHVQLAKMSDPLLPTLLNENVKLQPTVPLEGFASIPKQES